MKAKMLCENYEGFNSHLNNKTSRVIGAAVLVAATLGSTLPALSTIDNTVTASGTAPGGVAGAVQATADEEVDVEDADPQVVVTKVATHINGTPIADPDTANAGVGDVITYTYTFLNDGNVTITGISYTDSHTGNGTLTENDDEVLTDNSPLNADLAATDDDSTDAIAGNGTWSSLAPDDLVTFTSSYTVVQDDINDNGGGDGDLDNTVTFAATAVAGTIDPADLTISEEVDLEDQNPSLAVTKVASNDTNAALGETITYTYVVTNNGNVPITNVSLVDDVTEGSGPDPVPALQSIDNASGNTVDTNGPDNIIDTLYMGDSATFTADYIVTQSDVDSLQ